MVFVMFSTKKFRNIEKIFANHIFAYICYEHRMKSKISAEKQETANVQFPISGYNIPTLLQFKNIK